MTPAAPVVLAAQDGRLFRMPATVQACACELLAGGAPADLAARHGLDPAAVRGLLDQLRTAGVASLEPVGDGRAAPARRLQTRGISAIQLTVWRPGRRFLRLAPVWAACTGRVAQAVALLIAVVGIGAGLTAGGGGTLPERLSVPAAMVAIAATLFLTSLHELGHVLALGAYGLAPRRVGVMLFYGAFAMFSDVTPAWSLPCRRDKLRVILWGPLVTALEAGVVGVLAAQTGSPIALAVLYGLLLTFLVNLVPLARFDGYYLLVLWRDQPRLRDNGVAALRSVLRRAPEAGTTARGPAAFGLACVAYGCVLWAVALVQALAGARRPDPVGAVLAAPPLLPVYLVALGLLAGFVFLTLRAPISGRAPVRHSGAAPGRRGTLLALAVVVVSTTATAALLTGAAA